MWGGGGSGGGGGGVHPHHPSHHPLPPGGTTGGQEDGGRPTPGEGERGDRRYPCRHHPQYEGGGGGGMGGQDRPPLPPAASLGESFTRWMTEALAGTSYSLPHPQHAPPPPHQPPVFKLSGLGALGEAPLRAPGVRQPGGQVRSHSLDQLNFQEKRQLIASTLSLCESHRGKRLRGDGGNLPVGRVHNLGEVKEVNLGKFIPG